ncbi:MAG TPA: VWA domain-containing protein [Myxococcota bacterium]|nr:VWA domain-containing protein [Myxococcota bacterium]
MSELDAPWLAVIAIALGVARSAWRGRAQLAAWLGRDPAGWRRPLGALALAVAAACLGLALRWAVSTPEERSGDGADVVLAIDTSTSMDVTDVAPSRLRRALRTAQRVVEHARGERLGLVVFAGDAFVALPLTQDRDAVLTYLRALDSDTVSVRGSELGRALTQAGRVFDPRSSRPRTLLLLTDGEDFGAPPESQIGALRALGVRVVAVGYGTSEGASVPGQVAQSEALRSGETTLSRRNDGLLQHIADDTDGAYFREIESRPTPEQLLPPREAQPAPTPARHRADSLAPLLALAAAALAAELWLSGGAFRARRAVTRVRFGLGLRRAHAAALALVALALGAFGEAGLVARGDAALAAHKPDDALALYHEAAATLDRDARLSIRIGNALFRLERLDQAASAYLEALRILDSDDPDTRFAASFNLGNTFAARQHFEEARDAYWAALVARPSSLEAKFNYEWAVAHIQPLPPAPEPQPSDSPKRQDRSSGPGQSTSQEPQPGEARPEKGSLDPQEAQRWLDTLDEPVGDALRQQITNATGGRARARPGGKTW